MRTKTTLFSLAFIAMMFSANVSHAQFDELRAYGGVNVGASLINMLFKSVSYADDPYWTASQIPPVQISADYKLADRFSLGLAVSYAHVGIDYLNPNLTNAQDGEFRDFSMKLDRINVGLRGLFYYTDHEMFDIYSGLRLGMNIYNYDFNSTDLDFTVDGESPFDGLNFSGKAAGFGLQVIGFGANIFPIENVGINLELCIGQPYFATIGVRYRL